ncbi:MAG: D-alanyl-D-alanine carboxypeptidase family protein [Actinobacteria bacterium]|nr:D-alanyl-D-alanine carboxypeptidase family protein [Actinomycetota bacterium]
MRWFAALAAVALGALAAPLLLVVLVVGGGTPAGPDGGTGTGGRGVVVPGEPIVLASVDGITVNARITGQVAAMVTAAGAGGVRLTGGGYRSPAAQIETRRANCGSSYYAIYEMPPSACRPPTARPGSSQHEVGLAIDFANCQSRGSACYRWLAANASKFSFYNLPSEPWHWSTTGR